LCYYYRFMKQKYAYAIQ